MTLEINNVELVAQREGFGKGLVKAARINPDIIGLGCDITTSVGMNYFAEAFPERFFSFGIAEQNVAGVSAGLALMKKIPVFATYAAFCSTRCIDQIRVSICYNNLHVVIGGAHAGVSVGPDGATHQALEDIAIMRSIPNMTVISPCDANQTEIAVYHAILNCNSPVYIRYCREPLPNFSPAEQIFEIGKAQILCDGSDVCIIATGSMVWNALKAVEILKEKNIFAKLINIHTIKPIDEECIVNAAEQCQCVVCCEEHQLAGGLGSAVAEVIVQNYPVPIEFCAIHDSFGESGTPAELFKKFHLTEEDIANAAIRALKRKK